MTKVPLCTHNIHCKSVNVYQRGAKWNSFDQFFLLSIVAELDHDVLPWQKFFKLRIWWWNNHLHDRHDIAAKILLLVSYCFIKKIRNCKWIINTCYSIKINYKCSQTPNELVLKNSAIWIKIFLRTSSTSMYWFLVL